MQFSVIETGEILLQKMDDAIRNRILLEITARTPLHGKSIVQEDAQVDILES